MSKEQIRLKMLSASSVSYIHMIRFLVLQIIYFSDI